MITLTDYHTNRSFNKTHSTHQPWWICRSCAPKLETHDQR